MNKIAKLISRLYIALLTLSLIPLTLSAQTLPDKLIIKDVATLTDLQDGDTITLRLSDGKLFTAAIKTKAQLQAENEYTRSYYLPDYKATININKVGNDIRGNIQVLESNYVWLLEYKEGVYTFNIAPRYLLIEE